MKQPILSVHVDRAGLATARLHEDGKVDITVTIPNELLPFFNALINVLEGRGPRKEGEVKEEV